MSPPLPLSGLRVLDCSRLMPFSYGTQLLADLGAEVVKLEAPGGEYGRGMPEVFDLTNRGKRSITLDLRAEPGRALFGELLGQFDAMLETFRPGYLAGLGLGYEAVAGRHRRLVYCSATGFGQTGPYANRPGHDVTYAALAGLLAPAGGVPVVAPVPYVDMVAGWSVALAIMVGVFEARATGLGRHLDVGMADVALSLNLLSVAYGALPRSPDQPAGPLAGYPWPELMEQGCPCYGVFETSDGAHIALANVEPKFWHEFLAVVGRPDLSPDRFAVGARAAQVRAELAAIVAARTAAEWNEAFREREVCFAPVRTAASALAEEQFTGRGVAVRRPGGGWDLHAPIRLGTDEPPPPAVPEPGRDNEAIFGELGYGRSDISRWRSEGVL